jgi:hypothetical protein
MVNAVSLLINAITSFLGSNIETKQEKYRRDMVKYLNQAQDRAHLEYLEREWERTHGRAF